MDSYERAVDDYLWEVRKCSQSIIWSAFSAPDLFGARWYLIYEPERFFPKDDLYQALVDRHNHLDLVYMFCACHNEAEAKRLWTFKSRCDDAYMKIVQ